MKTYDQTENRGAKCGLWCKMWTLVQSVTFEQRKTCLQQSAPFEQSVILLEQSLDLKEQSVYFGGE